MIMIHGPFGVSVFKESTTENNQRPAFLHRCQSDLERFAADYGIELRMEDIPKISSIWMGGGLGMFWECTYNLIYWEYNIVTCSILPYLGNMYLESSQLQTHIIQGRYTTKQMGWWRMFGIELEIGKLTAHLDFETISCYSDNYPLVVTHIAVENHHFEWKNPHMAISHGYVNSPEGNRKVEHRT